MTVSEQKQAQRRAGRTARRALSAQARAAANAALCANLWLLDAVQNAQTILLYAAFGSEADLSAFAEKAQAQGKTLAYPVCGEAYSLTAAVPGPDGWEVGQYGIRTPILSRSEILLPEPVEDMETLAALLTGRAGHRVTLRVPQRGERAELLRMAGRNAREEVERITSDAERVNKTLEQLQQLADLPVLPRRMESYDISHTAGQDMVASMVVFVDGKPLKRDYRRFQVKSLDHADDLRALQEVLQRRMQRYLDGDEHFSPLPDLLLMDGGHLQAQATQQQLESMGIHVPILGMVKDDRHRTRALVTPEGRELGIQQSPPLFALVGRVQEEVHRFAITYHHEKHSRSAMTSRLDGIPGIGDVRKKALLKHFKSVKAISEAELVQLEALLPKAAARAVYDHFHEKNT